MNRIKTLFDDYDADMFDDPRKPDLFDDPETITEEDISLVDEELDGEVELIEDDATEDAVSYDVQPSDCGGADLGTLSRFYDV